MKYINLLSLFSVLLILPLSGIEINGYLIEPGSDLSGADLSGADLSGADLPGADLSGANLSGANLSGANLSGANLSGANLSGANLSNTFINGANLVDSALSHVVSGGISGVPNNLPEGVILKTGKLLRGLDLKILTYPNESSEVNFYSKEYCIIKINNILTENIKTVKLQFKEDLVEFKYTKPIILNENCELQIINNGELEERAYIHIESEENDIQERLSIRNGSFENENLFISHILNTADWRGHVEQSVINGELVHQGYSGGLSGSSQEFWHEVYPIDTNINYQLQMSSPAIYNQGRNTQSTLWTANRGHRSDDVITGGAYLYQTLEGIPKSGSYYAIGIQTFLEKPESFTATCGIKLLAGETPVTAADNSNVIFDIPIFSYGTEALDVVGDRKIITKYFKHIFRIPPDVSSGKLTLVLYHHTPDNYISDLETTRYRYDNVGIVKIGDLPEGEYDNQITNFMVDTYRSDSDKDGVTDHEEARYGLNPFSNDTDNDGYPDFWEVYDRSPPDVVLFGSEEVFLKNNEVYIDRGITAYDYFDNKVTILTETDYIPGKDGIYYTEYKVTDRAGNTVIRKRKISVGANEETIKFHPGSLYVTPKDDIYFLVDARCVSINDGSIKVYVNGNNIIPIVTEESGFLRISLQLDNIYSIGSLNISLNLIDETSETTTFSIFKEVALFYEDFDNLILQANQDEKLYSKNAWTHSGPDGWLIDNSGVPGFGDPLEDGVTEWAGWSYADKNWWIEASGDQQRHMFTESQKTVLIADPDEWDDKPHPSGDFNTMIYTPVIDLEQNNSDTLYLQFNSSFRPYANQNGSVEVSIDNGEYKNLLNLSSNINSSDYLYNLNQNVFIPISLSSNSKSIQFRFSLLDAGNDWWWAIDNIKLSSSHLNNDILHWNNPDLTGFHPFNNNLFDFSGWETVINAQKYEYDQGLGQLANSSIKLDSDRSLIVENTNGLLNINESNEGTLSFWAKFEGAHGTFRVNLNNEVYQFCSIFFDLGQNQMWFGDTEEIIKIPNNLKLSNGNWHHFCIRVDKDKIDLLIDCVRIGGLENVNRFQDKLQTVKFILEADNRNQSLFLDNLRIYNRKLDLSEIYSFYAYEPSYNNPSRKLYWQHNITDQNKNKIENLTSHYPFTENYDDYSPKGQNIKPKILNDNAFVQFKDNGATLDSLNQYFLIQDGWLNLSNRDKWTLGFWVYLEADRNIQGKQTLYSETGFSGGGLKFTLEAFLEESSFYVSSANVWTEKSGPNWTTITPSTSDLSYNEWHHITITYGANNSNLMTFYADGNDIGGGPTTIIDRPSDNNLKGDICIGCSQHFGSTWGSLKGSISHFKTLSEALSPEEVKMLMDDTTPVAEFSDEQTPYISIADISAGQNNIVNVQINAGNFLNIAGFQFTFNWDSEVLTPLLVDNTPIVISKWKDSSGLSVFQSTDAYLVGSNLISVVWDDIYSSSHGVTIENEDVILEFPFKIIGNYGKSGFVRFVYQPAPTTIVSSSGVSLEHLVGFGQVVIDQFPDLSGSVFYGNSMHSKPLSQIKIGINHGDLLDYTYTNLDGIFNFTLNSFENVIIRPEIYEGNSKITDGVDVADIVEVRKHILAKSKLSEPENIVAADTNRDLSVDVGDIVAMRKVILNRTDYFTLKVDGSKDTFWRFVNSNFITFDPESALDFVESSETIIYDSVNSDLNELDFLAIKLGDVNGDWTDPNATTLSGRDGMVSAGLMRLSTPKPSSDGSVSIDLHADGTEGLLGLQFGLNWDGQVLRLEGIENHQLPGFNQQAHSHFREGSAQLAWDNALLSNLNLDGNQPVMTLYFALQPGADRGTSIQLTQPLLVGSMASERAVMGVGSYYHPEGGSMLSSQGLIRSIHRTEGSLSLEFATQKGVSYALESTQNLASGQWEVITTVEGSGRHEVTAIPTTEEVQAYLRVREVSGVTE